MRMGSSLEWGGVVTPDRVTPFDYDTARRPPIAHLPRDGTNIGLCGTPMQGIPAPPEADRCCVCADLGGVEL
jgi:hypothetical protein